jgi:WD40 repeat protein
MHTCRVQAAVLLLSTFSFYEPDLCFGAGKKGPTAARKLVDLYGDPLPQDAIARLGSVRFHHPGGVNAMAFATDGQAILAVGYDNEGPSCRIWETDTGKTLTRFDLNRKSSLMATCAAFALNGKAVVFGRGEVIEVYDRATGKLLRTFDKHNNNTFALSSDGALLAAGSNGSAANNPILLWNVATGKQLPPFAGRGWDLCELKFSADNKRLLSASGPTHEQRKEETITIPGAICVWDVATRKKLHEVPNLTTNVAFAPDGRTVVLESPKEGIRVLNMATGAVVSKVRAKPGSAMAFTPDGKALVSVSADEGPRLWNAASGKEVHRFKGHQTNNNRLGGISPDGKKLAVINGNWLGDGAVRLWNVSSGEEIRHGGGHQDEVLAVAFSPSGKLLASAGRDHSVRLWEPRTGKELRRLRGHQVEVYAVAFAPDGKTLASVGADATIRLWDVASGRELAELKHGTRKADGLDWNEERGGALLFSPDSRVLIAADRKGACQVWDVKTRKILQRFQIDKDTAVVLGISPDARVLLSADNRALGFDETPAEMLRLWAVPTGEAIQAIPLRKSSPAWSRLPCWAAVASANGKLLASSQSHISEGLRIQIGEHHIRLWERATSQEVLRITTTMTQAVAFSPDGRALAGGHGGFYRGHIGFRRNSISLWSPLTGDLLHEFEGHSSQVHCVAFSPDGQLLASAAGDHTILVWDYQRKLLFKKPGPKPTRKQVEDWWQELASAEAATAHRAVGKLVANPGPALSVLREKLRPVPPVDTASIKRHIEALGSSEFAVRQQASLALGKMADLAEPAMRQALEDKRGDIEVRRRLERLLSKVEKTAVSPTKLQTQRAITALEWIADAEARRTLKALARGAPEARSTREAQASLQRLKK